MGKMNRNYVRLVLIRTAKPAQRSTLKNRLAFLRCHFVDFHDVFLLSSGLTESVADDLLSFANDHIQM